MREIKFRAWDGERMYRLDSAMWSADRGMHCLFIHEGERCHMIDAAQPATILQYTGLKDKNGKEICEGDIVRAVAVDHFCESSRVQDVFFDNDLQFVIRSEMVSSVGMSLTWGGWQSLEIIGNIYQNPELLKV